MAKTALTGADFQRLHLLATHASANAPHRARFHNTDASLSTMFEAPVGHVDQRDDYRSALSPAAYLADLIQLVDGHIVALDGSDQNGGRSLQSRRPDIFTLELTRSATDDEIPYLAIVNRVLRTYLEQNLGEPAPVLAQLAQARFPLSLPFHRPLAAIRAYLGHFGLGLSEIYAACALPADTPAWAAETLGLAPGELERLAAADPSAAGLNAAFGVTGIDETSPGGLDLAVALLAQAELNPSELSALTRIRLPDGPITLQGDGSTQTITNLTHANLEYLGRFLRLARRLNWPFADLDRALAALDPTATNGAVIDQPRLIQLALVERLRSAYGLPIAVLCCFWSDLPAAGPTHEAHNSTLFAQIFGDTPFADVDKADAAAIRDAAQFLGDTGRPSYITGIADRGGKQSIGLPELAAAASGAYLGMTIAITAGTGAGQSRTISAYRGATRLAIVDQRWATPPDRSSHYVLFISDADPSLRAALFGALGVSEADGRALLGHLLAQDGALKLDRSGLTRLYRLRRLAQMLKLSVADCLTFLTLITQPAGAAQYRYLASPEVHSIADLMIVREWATWLQGSGLSVAQLRFLTGTATDDAVSHAPTADATEAIYRSLLSDAGHFGIARPKQAGRFDLDTLRRISDLRALAQSFASQSNTALADSTAGLGRYLQQRNNAPDLPALSGWDAGAIAALSGRLDWQAPYSATQLATMQACFALADRLGVHMQLLIDLLALHTAADQPAFASWAEYAKVARTFQHVVRARFTPAERSAAFEPIDDRLNELERDALTAFLLARLRETGNTAISTRQDLYELLLIDIEMAGCARTTALREAIDCVQIFIQRCRMGLEPRLGPSAAIPDQLWDWMGHYRLWQANRKVLLYPENYLDPTLRTSGATPEFKALQNALLQNNPTHDLAEQLYIDYIEQLDELDDLEIVGSCFGEAPRPTSDKPQLSMFLLGKTATEPPVYYERRASLTESFEPADWSPWQKINVTIQADQALPLFTAQRLYIFWVEQKTVYSRDKDGTRHATFLASIKFSRRQAGGQWLHPQTLIKDMNLAALPAHVPFAPEEPPTPIFLARQADGPDGAPRIALSLLAPEWQITLEPLAASLIGAPHRAIGGIVRPSRAQPRWTQVGPQGQTEQIIALGGRLLARSAGGLIISDDAGATWNPVAGLTGWAQLWALSPRLFATDSTGRLFVSDDQAGSWSAISGITGQVSALVSFGDTVVISTEVGLPNPTNTRELRLQITNFVSVDRGNTWAQAAGLTGRIEGSATSANQNFIVAGGLFRMAAPTVWTPVAAPGNWKRAIVAAGDRLFLSTSEGMYLSADNGQNWSQTTAPAGIAFPNIVVSGNRLFAPTVGGLFMSADQGATWAQVTGISGEVQAVVAIGDRLFAGASLGLYMSADNGGAWVQVEGVPGSVTDVFATDSLIFAATSAGLYRIDRASGLFETAALFPLIAANNAAWLAVPQRRQGDQPAYWLRRLTTGVIGRLRGKLAAAGIDALLTLEMQQLPEAPSVADLQPSARVLEPAASDRLSFADDTPYSLYFREIFFHIPYLVGRVLQQHQRFAESRRWYAYIFDPQAFGEAGPDRFWRYLPFRGHHRHALAQALSSAQLQVAEAEPFDPFVIADIRPEAYQKAIAMQAIDNLLAWADALYAQDGWENLNAATTLYVLVAELLGPPAVQPPQAGETADPPQLLAAGKQAHQVHPDMRNLLPAAKEQGDTPGLSIPSFFFLPENDQFAGYWTLANRRLAQIRTCLNVQGVARQLLVYDAPIDPRQLVRAVAAGRMLDSIADAAGTAPSDTSAIPHYRFSTMLGRAREIVGELRQLGGALLSALEKHDAERLAVLRNTYEGAILNLTTQIKQKQQQEAAHSLDSLQRNLDLAQARYERYQSWADEYLSPGEQSGLAQTQAASLLKHIGSLITGLSAIGYAIPNIYGLADGGMNFGKVIEVGAETLAVEASIMEWAGQMALTKAQYDRRKADWQLMADQARVEAQQMAAQIRAQQARQDMADQELRIHQESISQNQDLDQYFTQKFSSPELYQWMVGRIGTLYGQTYQIALSLARMAERAFQYERNTTDSYIQADSWDSFRQGLLADESLALNLNQMEKAYIEQNVRELEIEKTISLNQIAPLALRDLKRSGQCRFLLREALFDLDFPGHYLRKIKSVSLSIPAVVGPYQNIHAVLTQLTNYVVLATDPAAVRALVESDQPPAGANLRANWHANQQIALSRGMNDAGLFEVNFNDERYLPFEGTGAVSTWELRMPRASNQFAFASISDVIITIHYTARDGGDAFRKQLFADEKIAAALTTLRGYRVFTLRQLNAAGWQAVRTGMQSSLEFTLSNELFPPNLERLTTDSADGELTTIAIYPWPEQQVTQPGFTLRLPGGTDLQPSQASDPPLNGAGWSLKPSASAILLGKWQLSFQGGSAQAAALQGIDDLLVIVPFTGTLDWPVLP